jgi:hypothetical protein
MEALRMSDDLRAAHKRARGPGGESVWAKLSGTPRATAIEEEMHALNDLLNARAPDVILAREVSTIPK